MEEAKEKESGEEQEEVTGYGEIFEILSLPVGRYMMVRKWEIQMNHTMKVHLVTREVHTAGKKY